MRQTILAGLLLIFASLAAAQAGSNSLTVSVSRTLTVQADQELYNVFVYSGIDQGLDDILAVLKPAGITAGNFSSVFQGSNTPGTSLQWTFALVAPLTNTKATVATLTNLQNSIAKTNPNLKMTFDFQDTQVSPQAAQSQTCPMAPLLSDANAKAQTMAAAANRFLGGIIALATSTSPGQTTCSITVKFSLIGFNMRLLWFGTALLIVGLPAFAQLDPFTVTVTASRSVSVAPDTIVVNVFVEANPNTSLSDVLAVVQSIGLSQANLTTVYNVIDRLGAAMSAVWSFTLTVPTPGLKSRLSKLDSLQATQVKNHSDLSVTYQVTGVRASPQAQAAQTCPTATLISDARAQAQALAQAAGFGVGEILTMSDSGAALEVGSSAFFALAGIAIYAPAPPAPSSCTATVTFKLTLV